MGVETLTAQQLVSDEMMSPRFAGRLDVRVTTINHLHQMIALGLETYIAEHGACAVGPIVLSVNHSYITSATEFTMKTFVLALVAATAGDLNEFKVRAARTTPVATSDPHREYPFVGGPWDHTSHRTNGDHFWRVPIVRPMSFTVHDYATDMMPTALSTPEMDYVDYTLDELGTYRL